MDYVLRTSIDQMKENCFTLKKARRRRYSADTVTGVDSADDRAFLPTTSIQAESYLWPPREIRQNGMHVFLWRSRYPYSKWCLSEIDGQDHESQLECLIYWKWQYAISEVMVCYWLVIDHMEVRWNKTQFLPSSCVNSTIWMHKIDADEAYGAPDENCIRMPRRILNNFCK